MNAAAADYQALKQQRVRKNELVTADHQLPTSNCRTAKKQRVRKNELAKNILISNF